MLIKTARRHPNGCQVFLKIAQAERYYALGLAQDEFRAVVADHRARHLYAMDGPFFKATPERVAQYREAKDYARKVVKDSPHLGPWKRVITSDREFAPWYRRNP